MPPAAIHKPGSGPQPRAADVPANGRCRRQAIPRHPNRNGQPSWCLSPRPPPPRALPSRGRRQPPWPHCHGTHRSAAAVNRHSSHHHGPHRTPPPQESATGLTSAGPTAPLQRETATGPAEPPAEAVLSHLGKTRFPKNPYVPKSGLTNRWAVGALVLSISDCKTRVLLFPWPRSTLDLMVSICVARMRERRVPRSGLTAQPLEWSPALLSGRSVG